MYLIEKITFNGEYRSADKEIIGYIESYEDMITYLSKFGKVEYTGTDSYMSGEFFGTRYDAFRIEKIKGI